MIGSTNPKIQLTIECVWSQIWVPDHFSISLIRALGCSELQEPPKNPKKLACFWCAVTHARNRNAWVDHD